MSLRLLTGVLESTSLTNASASAAVVLSTKYDRLRLPIRASETLTRRDSQLHNTIFIAGIKYGKLCDMETERKITVEVPAELLERAQRASGAGITQTVRTGLQLVAASEAYARLRQLRGRVRFTRTLGDLKADR